MTFRNDGQALASVLGAILLFGLVVSTVVTVQARYVPVWDHDREARLMDGVAAQMMLAQSELQHQVANRSTAALDLPVPLAPPSGTSSLFQGTMMPGTLSLRPAPGSFSWSAPHLTLPATNGADLLTLSESWQAIPASGTVTGITSIDHLRIRLHNPSSNNGVLSLTLLDSGGACTGKLTLTNVDETSDFAVVARVYGAAGGCATPITEQTQSWKKNTPDPDYYLDAFSPTLGFGAVLRSQTGTFSLAWANGIANDEDALVYTTSGGSQVGGGGPVVPNFQHAMSSSLLVAARANQRFARQTYTLEAGALILDQPDGAAMVAPPAFSVHMDAGRPAISWSVPQLVGTPAQVGGARAAQVGVVPLGVRLDVHAAAPRLTFILPTTHPALWASYWDTTLRDAGLTGTVALPGDACGTGPGYNICTASAATCATTPSACVATLDVRGANTDQTTDDLHIDYDEANLAVVLLSTG